MPEGRRRRCPNVINIFRARGAEKDCLPSSFLHPPAARIILAPAPIFLPMHPPPRGRPQIFNLHFSSTHSLIPLPHPSATTIAIVPSRPPLRFPQRPPRLNSQRPHREESVNAKGKRERRTSNLPGLRFATLRKLFFSQKLQFRRIYMASLESRGSSN